jgi:hypothetical protein
MSIYLHHQNKLLLIFLALFSFAFAQENMDTGTLSIKLNSPGYIYIDSEYISNKSIKNLTLKSGEYKISVFSSKSRKWNERGFEKIITILPDQNKDLVIENTNLYYFNSNPYNSKILQNNKTLGSTPIYINSNEIDISEKLTIQKIGYTNKDIFIAPNQNKYFFILKPESIKSEIVVASPGLNNSQATWFKEGFVVVSLLSSWAAFYFKREADKYYAKYPRVGDVSLMNKYYNKTKRFDTYSDISISVSVASLGTYMYFLIFD